MHAKHGLPFNQRPLVPFSFMVRHAAISGCTRGVAAIASGVQATGVVHGRPPFGAIIRASHAPAAAGVVAVIVVDCCGVQVV